MPNHDSGPESIAPEFFKPRKTWYPADEPDQPGWPPGVKQISLESLGMMGIDQEGRLYWEGRPVEIARRFSMTLLQKAGALAGIAAAVAVAAVEWLRFFGAGWDK